jgi:hypothetical protein
LSWVLAYIYYSTLELLYLAQLGIYNFPLSPLPSSFCYICIINFVCSRGLTCVCSRDYSSLTYLRVFRRQTSLFHPLVLRTRSHTYVYTYTPNHEKGLLEVLRPEDWTTKHCILLPVNEKMNRDMKMGNEPVMAENDKNCRFEGYFTYRPLSNLPTPPPSSRNSSAAQSPRTTLDDGEPLMPRFRGEFAFLPEQSRASRQAGDRPMLYAMSITLYSYHLLCHATQHI